MRVLSAQHERSRASARSASWRSTCKQNAFISIHSLDRTRGTYEQVGRFVSRGIQVVDPVPMQGA